MVRAVMMLANPAIRRLRGPMRAMSRAAMPLDMTPIVSVVGRNARPVSNAL